MKWLSSTARHYRANGTQAGMSSEHVAPSPEPAPDIARAPLIELDNLHKVYQTADVPVHAVRGISLKIRHGELVAIMGASGSGKSTLMNILGCLDRPSEGRYVLDGVDVSMLDRDQLADLGAQPRPPESRAGPPPPEESPALPMPADDRLGPDQDEVPPPIAAHTTGENPDQPVPAADRRSLPRPEGDRELVAQQDVLEDEITATPQRRAQ